ncbi:MAG: iron uptake porin [Chlorogloeopsis fritschii C42_A2020_084]|uniref:iron uptake porin n=1 Tax=Chlorogloeopsis fritschii TaxID=1124 RepID=UPI001A0DE83F|nr:iron uptake porin [Chlorogloeopsis fritschii]MBF2004482.1 iron uptake porin [Chlorogloeopsis fritschii C42_A2020_084]
MSKLLWKCLLISPGVLLANLAFSGAALSAEIPVQTEVKQQANSLPKDSSLSQTQQYSDETAQVTSVSQFSDVQPTDWAFQALQSLVERYGCIAGYPNGTYRGNRALTRYEFAAGLNACLDRVNELIATATADLVTKEDLATLQRLQEEFSAELATLRGRVDTLEARTAELEANQFSTTTKLVGEVIFNVSDIFGSDKRAVPSGVDSDTAPDLDSNIIFADRVRLRLNSSFTGSDLLQIRLQSRNITPYDTNVTGTNMTRFGFDGNQDNDTVIDKVNYTFNLSDAVQVKVDAAGGNIYDNINNFNPDLASDGKGALSRYGRFSPIYRTGFGGAGATITFNPKGSFSASAAYIARTANNPGSDGGLTNGAYTALGQIAFQPSDAFNIGLTYARNYQNSLSGVNMFEGTGSVYAGNPFNGVATVANHYGVEVAFKPSSKLTISGWYGYSNAEAKADGTGVDEGDEASMNYWTATLALKDFGKEGNLLGLIFGQPPKVSDNDAFTSAARTTRREDNDTSYHLEALYRLQLTDNISVTPGAIVIFNPEHNNDNDTIYVGTLRTTFTF